MSENELLEEIYGTDDEYMSLTDLENWQRDYDHDISLMAIDICYN